MTEIERLDKLADKIAGVVFPCGLLLLASGPGIWAWQCLRWLQTGDWPSLPTVAAFAYFGFDPPRFSWVGVQKINDWMMAAPLSAALMALAFAILLTFVTWSDSVHDKAKDERLARNRERLFGEK